MKRYKCHKIVEAAKIVAAERNAKGEPWRVVCDDHSTNLVASNAGITEEDKGYLVRYSDGYTSWSPTKAFEEGYSAIYEDVPGSSFAHLQLTTFDNQLLVVADYHPTVLLKQAKSKAYERGIYIAMFEGALSAIHDRYKD